MQPDLSSAPPRPAAFLAPGTRLGRYELIRRLAVGGMAELYLARATGIAGFEKLVALKRILPQYAESNDFVAMFLDEARLAATIHHPNVAQVYDIGRSVDGLYFTMEYVQGEDLRGLLSAVSARRDRMPLEHAVGIAIGAAAGLHAAHELTASDGSPLGIVHRDVSPSNVLISHAGAVKIIDFGIAKAARRQAETRAGTLKGKVAYMSPEQCSGGVVDRRSDVFSLGILLWEMTVGRRLYNADSEYMLLRQIVDEDAPRPTQIVPGYPPALEVIVMRALRRSRDERLATAQELQLELEDFARRRGLAVSPVQLGRFMREVFPDRAVQHPDHGGGSDPDRRHPIAIGTPQLPGSIAAKGSAIGSRHPVGARGSVPPGPLRGHEVEPAKRPSGRPITGRPLPLEAPPEGTAVMTGPAIVGSGVVEAVPLIDSMSVETWMFRNPMTEPAPAVEPDADSDPEIAIMPTRAPMVAAMGLRQIGRIGALAGVAAAVGVGIALAVVGARGTPASPSPPVQATTAPSLIASPFPSPTPTPSPTPSPSLTPTPSPSPSPFPSLITGAGAKPAPAPSATTRSGRVGNGRPTDAIAAPRQRSAITTKAPARVVPAASRTLVRPAIVKPPARTAPTPSRTPARTVATKPANAMAKPATIKPAAIKGPGKSSAIKPAALKATAKPAALKGTAKPAALKGTAKPAAIKGTAKPAVGKPGAKPAKRPGRSWNPDSVLPPS